MRESPAINKVSESLLGEYEGGVAGRMKVKQEEAGVKKGVRGESCVQWIERGDAIDCPTNELRAICKPSAAPERHADTS